MPKILQNSSKLYILSLLLIISALTSIKAQELLKKAKVMASVGAIVSSDSSTPFLLRSNQYGVVPFESGTGYFNVNLSQNYDSLYTIDRKLKRFAYGYGLEVHTNLGRANQLLLPVAHFKVRYGAFEFYAGRRREIQGLVDTLGTMGSYIWSGNALPMPKLEISIPNYTPILGKGLISIKGNFAHGWFGRGDSVQNVLLHQKSFYAKLGKPTWKVHFFGGFNHQVQWGGYPTVPFYDEASKQTVSHYSTDLATYAKVVTGISLNKNGDGISTGAPSNEALNRVGNHLGTIDVGFDITFRNNRILFYRQSIFEDGSLNYLNNISDGLTGISLNRASGTFKTFCLEYFDTRSQGGAIYFGNIPQLRGADNYSNNSIYRDNWTYRNNVIGTPLFTTFNNAPINKNDTTLKNYGRNQILNNRVKAFSISMNYLIKNIVMSTSILNYLNLGSYQTPISFKQNSFSSSAQTYYKKTIIKLKIAFDGGQYWNKNIGIQLELKKYFNL